MSDHLMPQNRQVKPFLANGRCSTVSA